MGKKLAIQITYPCGRVSEKRFTTKKGSDNEFKRLTKDPSRPIYDSFKRKYISGYTVKQIK